MSQFTHEAVAQTAGTRTKIGVPDMIEVLAMVIALVAGALALNPTHSTRLRGSGAGGASGNDDELCVLP